METLKVEQCDRDAAADLYLALDGDLPTHEITEEADRHRRGDRDHTAPVQAFARHRIAERERCAGICDEMEQDQNGRAYDKRQAGRDDTHNCAKAAAAGQLAQAIREQSNG